MFPIRSRVGANRRFETIMDFGRHRVDVALRCNGCRHTRFLTLEQVVDIFGLATRIGRAELRLRCTRCGHKGGRMAPIPQLEPKRRE